MSSKQDKRKATSDYIKLCDEIYTKYISNLLLNQALIEQYLSENHLKLISCLQRHSAKSLHTSSETMDCLLQFHKMKSYLLGQVSKRSHLYLERLLRDKITICNFINQQQEKKSLKMLQSVQSTFGLSFENNNIKINSNINNNINSNISDSSSIINGSNGSNSSNGSCLSVGNLYNYIGAKCISPPTSVLLTILNGTNNNDYNSASMNIARSFPFSIARLSTHPKNHATTTTMESVGQIVNPAVYNCKLGSVFLSNLQLKPEFANNDCKYINVINQRPHVHETGGGHRVHVVNYVTNNIDNVTNNYGISPNFISNINNDTSNNSINNNYSINSNTNGYVNNNSNVNRNTNNINSNHSGVTKDQCSQSSGSDLRKKHGQIRPSGFAYLTVSRVGHDNDRSIARRAGEIVGVTNGELELNSLGHNNSNNNGSLSNSSVKSQTSSSLSSNSSASLSLNSDSNFGACFGSNLGLSNGGIRNGKGNGKDNDTRKGGGNGSGNLNLNWNWKSNDNDNYKSDEKLRSVERYDHDMKGGKINKAGNKNSNKNKKNYNYNDDLFHCNYPRCRKKYKLKSSFDAHVVTHDGFGFGCDTCGKIFPRKQNLQEHLRIQLSNLIVRILLS